MRLSVSPQINALLDAAATLSVRRGQYFVGVEHLFEVLVQNMHTLPPRYVESGRDNLNVMARQLERRPWQGRLPEVVRDVFHTPRCANALNEASRLAERLGGDVESGHLLLALLSDAHSGPSRIMDGLGMDRARHIDTLRTALATPAPSSPKADGRPERPPTPKSIPPRAEPDPREADGVTTADVLARCTRDLSALARSGKIEPAIGRDTEVGQIIEVISRKNKNNAILVGDAGVGKTKIIEGLALALAKGGLGAEFSKFKIVELNLSALMAGTQYRGAFEERLNALLDSLKSDARSILFIDEIHLIMGAGATDGGGMDLANLLKPALARGEIRCIGATTLEEYRRHIARDAAMERRFQMVRVEALSPQATYEVLKKLRPGLQEHHGVGISKRALRAAIVLTQRYMPDRNLPDKAIDVLDQTCARYRLKVLASENNPQLVEFSALGTADGKVTPYDVQKVVSRLTNIPIEEISTEERKRLSGLDQQLKKAIIGQDEAVARVSATVKRFRAGLADPNRPDAVMLFLGPTGVGKTQMAKALAHYVFGSKNHLIRFDMTEYGEPHTVSKLIGAPPGYVGHEDEGLLSDAASRHPFGILLFDEIEKAHAKVFDIFLPLLDEGRIKDARGRELNFKNNIIIFTSNIGAELLMRGHDDDQHGRLIEALHGHFRPEFINRIDDIVPFFSLLPEDVRAMLAINLKDISNRLKEQGLEIRVFQRAYDWLAKKGYNPEFGARELRRIVERHVVTPISTKLLEGKFSRGDVVEVREENGELVFEPAVRSAGRGVEAGT